VKYLFFIHILDLTATFKDLDGVVVVRGELAPLDSDGVCGWVGGGFACCGMVASGIAGGDRCAR
jgi:hypothetical protein